MRLDGLIGAMNEIVGLKSPPTADQLGHVCAVACRELTIMGDDEAFQDLVRQAPARLADASPDVRAVFDDLSRFGAFMQEELRVMIEAGLDARVAEALLDETRSFRQTMTSARTSAATLRADIFRLRDEVCQLEAALKRTPDGAAIRRRIRIALRGAAWVIGGGTIVVVNTTFGHLLPEYKDASVSVGTQLIGHGLRGG